VKLDILNALNAERAARRAVVVVTDVTSGDSGWSRLRTSPRIRCMSCSKAHAHGEERHGGDGAGQSVSHRARAVAATRHYRRCSHQPGAGAIATLLDYDVTIVDRAPPSPAPNVSPM